MKVFIKDLRTDKSFELSKCDIKLINIGHTLSIKYMDKYNNIKEIEGTIIAIKHKISLDYSHINF